MAVQSGSSSDRVCVWSVQIKAMLFCKTRKKANMKDLFGERLFHLLNPCTNYHHSSFRCINALTRCKFMKSCSHVNGRKKKICCQMLCYFFKTQRKERVTPKQQSDTTGFSLEELKNVLYLLKPFLRTIHQGHFCTDATIYALCTP